MINNLATFRKQAGYTQAELAKLCKCSRETIANLERGKYNPSLKLCYRIKNAINASPRIRIEFYLEDIFPEPEHNENRR